ncbi:DUF4435 domain-containing protein [Lysinibacillus sp. NPDC094403]|uniref:DUF4435 domain-containing protein n=1 Tax=Lysinibacillus sp. NPDC094403 TaxID=3390581 RepID=UPI003CFCD1D0
MTIRDERKERYKNKTTCTSAIIHRLSINFPKYRENPICFVEGYDSDYYQLRVQLRCSNKTPYFINCGGKENVTKVFDKVSSRIEYEKGRLMFFVDSDFDDSLQNPSIYETPCYAIENLYTSCQAVKKILEGLFKLEDNIVEKILKLYQILQGQFHEAIQYFTAWIFLQKNCKENIRLNLKDLKIKDLVNITLENVTSIYTLQFIEGKFPHAKKINHQDIQKKCIDISKENPQTFYRGKYEMEFLAKFLCLIQENLGSKDSSIRKFGDKKKIPLTIYDPISQFSQYADTPECLIEYINTKWNKKSQVLECV